MSVPDVAEVVLPPGIVRIELPMTGNPLRFINGYLLEGKRGYVLIDCGWDLPDVWDALVAGLALAGLRVGDITDLVCTHFHPDHYGLAGRLVRTVGARLMMHRLDWDVVRTRLADAAVADRASDAWLVRNGLAVMPDVATSHRQVMKYSVVEPARFLADGDAIELANGGALRAVWTPGHSPGHFCFHDAQRGVLFTGDHILDPITPHVGLWFDLGTDPLGDFIASLQKAKAAGASVAAPAHGRPFADPGLRADALVAHHHTREAAVVAAFEGAEPVTAGAVAHKLPWTRRQQLFSELSDFHQQFALAETIAHLEHLRRHGRVHRIETHDRILYEMRR
jgi:glyoxylase-like metal-dependent hydrolase (beta-lactamase superfamily II)